MDFREKLKISFNATTALIIIIAIIGLINVLAARHFIRADLTVDQRYTISNSTKNILANLDDTITLKIFYSKKFPPNILSAFQKIKDLIGEYQAYSKGKLQTKYIDPADNPDLETEAKTLGIPQLPFDIIEKDQRQNILGYLGIAILYGDKKETIPVIQGLDTLEYELTAAIKKVTAVKLKKIGFLTGHDEHKISQNNAISSSSDNQSDFTLIAEALKKNYDVSEVSIANGTPIQDIDTLIIAGPKESLSERDIFEIDQFIMSGKTVVFLADQINTDNIMAVKEINNPQLDNLLNHFGLSVSKNLIMDNSNAVASFSTGLFTFATNYPFWPKLIRENFALDNPIIAKVESLVFPWVSSLNISTDKNPNSLVKTLASTTKESAAQTGSFNLDPQNRPQVKTEDLKQFPIIALISGKFKSYFADKPIPALATTNNPEINPDNKIVTPENAADQNRKITKETDKESQILVIGNSAFIADNFLQMFPQNGEFFLNAVDYLTLDPALVSIRSKQIFDRPIKELSAGQKMGVKAIGIGLMPALVILYGVLRVWKRKRNKYASII